MPRQTTPGPPSTLGNAGKKFWREILRDYEPETQDLARLEVACDCKDRIAEARKVLAKGYDRNATNTLRDFSKILLQTLRHLGLDNAK